MKIFPQLFSRTPRSPRSNNLETRNDENSIMSFWVSRSFDLGNLGVLEKSWGNIFNDYIFEISRFHWSKCTVDCAIYSILILKSAQARCVLFVGKLAEQYLQSKSYLKVNSFIKKSKFWCKFVRKILLNNTYNYIYVYNQIHS